MCGLSSVKNRQYLGVSSKGLYNMLCFLTLRNLLKTDIKGNFSTDNSWEERRWLLSYVSDRVSPGVSSLTEISKKGSNFLIIKHVC